MALKIKRCGSGVSLVSEESIMLRLKSKTSFYPVTTQEKTLTPLSKVDVCCCGDRKVVLYCKKHDALLCKACKYRDHVRCNVQKLEHVARGVLDSKDLDKTLKELNALKYVFEKLKQNDRLKKLQHRQEKKSMLKLSKRWNMLQSTRSAFKREVVHGMDQYGTVADGKEKVMVRKSRWVYQQLIDYLGELKEEIEKENEKGVFVVLHKVSRDLEKFRNVLAEITDGQTSGDVFEEMRTMVAGIYYCENQGSVTLARSLKPNVLTSNPDLKGKNSRIPSPSERSKSSQSFQRNSLLSSSSRRFRPSFRPQAIRMPTMLSSLRSGRSSRTLTKTRTSLTLKNQQIDRPVKTFSICSSTERPLICQVSAMSQLHDGKFCVIDCRNNVLKLFSADETLLAELDMGCSIWDLTKFTRSEVLITCPSEGKLQRVVIQRDNQLVKTGYILTQKDCRAIKCVANRIYISYCSEKPCIKILSRDGIMYRSIDGTKGKITLFKNPLYMHVAKLGKLIYVSDFSLQRLAKIDQKGNLLGIIDASPGWPLDLSMTREENLIVTVSGTNEIKMTPRGGMKWYTLIESRVTGDCEPSVMMIKDAYKSRQPKQLYVAFSGSSLVKVYSIV